MAGVTSQRSTREGESPVVPGLMMGSDGNEGTDETKSSGSNLALLPGSVYSSQTAKMPHANALHSPPAIVVLTFHVLCGLEPFYTVRHYLFSQRLL